MWETRSLPLYAVVVFTQLLSSPNLSAQTVRPVVVEYKERARAKFELVNDTLYPLNVVLEPRSFTLSTDGQPTFRPLEDHIHLKLSAMSFRLPPQQTRMVFYEAWAHKLPAWFVIYCTFAGFPQQSGLSIQVELPHTVYLLQKERLAESDFQVRLVAFEAGINRALIEVENVGPRLARVLSVEVSSRSGEKRAHGSFPLMPESRRQLAIPWSGEEPPGKVKVRFLGFTVERMLARD